MADTHETIADIIAWLRRPREGENAYLTLWRDEIADRLEAAHKREAVTDCNQFGDAAKLREAVAKCVNLITEFGNAEIVKTPLDVIVDVEAILKAALAAPPRNCDRFASAEEAWDAYDEWADSYRSKGKTEPFNEVGWLFAPATEKEGGRK